MNICCWLLGHKYYVHAKPKEDWVKGIRWLRCARCKSDFIVNARIKVLLPMDFELKDMYEWGVQDETEGHDMQKIKDRYRSLREAGLIHPEKEVQDVHRT